eukprot:TRINITY_DN6364_c0_g3_i1.p1 TRINITY_DN6364_c0_g3~~TRINITY_DN6364_c0_g3_i1.p1  ORF type:complete len:346 (+),score=88.80 TRINITY_DN6364_c0_g3_i1:33-1070(+)
MVVSQPGQNSTCSLIPAAMPSCLLQTRMGSKSSILLKHLSIFLTTFIHLLPWVAGSSSSSSGHCAPSLAAPDGSLLPGSAYDKVVAPTLNTHHLADLPGFTRSVYARDHALVAPESHVYFPFPGWVASLGAYFITPAAMGSHFTMFMIQMAENSSSALPEKGVERFIFVLDGELEFSSEASTSTLKADNFAYVPPDIAHAFTSTAGARLIAIERKYTSHMVEGGETPQLQIGITSERPLLETPGEVFHLRKLLPTTSAYDFNIHIMDFKPGEYLNVKEVHYNQHGLLLLEGRGIYRLGESWYPVQAGDVIWMAPFVPQWYAALGTSRSRYLLYKDVNRDPVIHPF